MNLTSLSKQKMSPAFSQHEIVPKQYAIMCSQNFLIPPFPKFVKMLSVVSMPCRVAKWYICKPKLPILVYFGRQLEWEKVGQFGTFYGYLVYFMAVWYFVVTWYIFVYYCYFGTLHQEKSGNPDAMTGSSATEQIKIFRGPGETDVTRPGLSLTLEFFQLKFRLQWIGSDCRICQRRKPMTTYLFE
jgi:uncharacterized membrane protein